MGEWKILGNWEKLELETFRENRDILDNGKDEWIGNGQKINKPGNIDRIIGKQAEAEVVPSSSSITVKLS